MSHYYYFLGHGEQGSLVAVCWVSNIFNGSTLLTQIVFIFSMTAYLKCKPTLPNLSENSISQANNSLQVIISLFIFIFFAFLRSKRWTSGSRNKNMNHQL
jgi:hypothetical protein